jgi:hypothetical protein
MARLVGARLGGAPSGCDPSNESSRRYAAFKRDFVNCESPTHSEGASAASIRGHMTGW